MYKDNAIRAQLFAALFITALGWPWLALGQNSGFDIPTDCGDPTHFQSRVRKLVGPDTKIEWPQTLRIEPVERGYALTLQMRQLTRTLVDPDCQALFRTAVIMTATAVSPQVAHTELSVPQPGSPSLTASQEPISIAEPAAQSAAETTPSPAPIRPPDHQPHPVPPSARSTPRPVESHLGLSGRLGLSLFTGATPTLEIITSLQLGSWEAALDLNYQLRQRVANGSPYDAIIEAWGGRVQAGYALLDPWWLRLGPALHLVRGTGRSDDIVARSDHAYWLSLVAETVLLVDLNASLALEVAAHGRYSLSRPRFQVVGFGEVFRVARWSGGVAVGLRGQIF